MSAAQITAEINYLRSPGRRGCLTSRTDLGDQRHRAPPAV
jgi:hypothetical protein